MGQPGGGGERRPKQGDKVVVRGAGSLQDGDKVELFLRLNLGQIPIKNGSCGAVLLQEEGDYSTIITLQVLVLPTVSILSPWVSNTMSPLCSSPWP